YVATETHQLVIVPKCMSLASVSLGGWTDSLPAFLNRCHSLPPWAVIATGPNWFAPGSVLLSWWADYYSAVLTRAVQAFPYLRYEPTLQRQSFLRGNIVWSRQIDEWTRGG